MAGTYRTIKVKMIQCLKPDPDLLETIGEANNTVVCIGDWEQKQHMKYKAPHKGKGFRKTIRKYGYKVYLIDEHKTSKQCYNCKHEDTALEKFKPRHYVDRNNQQRTTLLHSLLKCTTCEKLWNRDANAARNQRDLAFEIIWERPRPLYLRRSMANPA